MKAAGYGRILMTTSAAGLYGNFGQSNYSAAKMALVGFMNALKQEGLKYNIRVNTIAPLAASRLTQDVMPPEIFERSQPELVVPMAIYLCSETCMESGSIYNAGMGHFSRAAVLTGPGVTLSDGDIPPTPEKIHRNWAAINSMAGARETANLTEAIMSMMRP
jgi:hypothetical protein